MGPGMMVGLELTGGLAGLFGTGYGMWRVYEWAWCRGYDIGSRTWKAAAERDAKALEEARHGQVESPVPGEGPVNPRALGLSVRIAAEARYKQYERECAEKRQGLRIHLADDDEAPGIDEARYGYRQYEAAVR